MTTGLHIQPAWIPTDEIATRRFDALYYDPALSVAEHHFRKQTLLAWKRLREISKELYSFGAYELTNQIKFVEPGPDSIPFINITDVGFLSIDMEKARHIDRDSHNLLEKSVCRPGTLLLSMSGSIGRVAVVPVDSPECNSNQHLAKVVIDADQADTYFIAAYFASPVGQAAFLREAAGAIQKELYLYNIEILPVPCPQKAIRLAIGNKLRAAERLRRSAETAIQAAKEKITTALGWPIPLDPTQSAFTPAADLDARFDPRPYLPRYAAIRRLIAKHPHKTLADMGVAAANGCEVRNFVPDGIPYLVAGDMKGWRLRPRPEWSHVPSDSDIPDKAVPKCGDAICVRTGSVGQMVSWEEEYGHAALCSDLIRLRGKQEHGFDACYLGILSQVGIWSALIDSIRYGAVQPKISQEELLELLVPLAGTKLAEDTGRMYQTAVKQSLRADDLTRQAIADVEHLIGGSLDEAKCLAQGRRLAAEFSMEAP
jgi:type I restriction enzyme, S subunit